MITASQIRAARRLLGWTQFELSKHSGISEWSIQKVETGRIQPSKATQAAIERALVIAGVDFDRLRRRASAGGQAD